MCQMCQKSYGRRDYLERHMKSHTPGGGMNGEPGMEGDTSGNTSGNEPEDVKINITGDNDATLNEVVTVVSPEDELRV